MVRPAWDLPAAEAGSKFSRIDMYPHVYYSYKYSHIKIPVAARAIYGMSSFSFGETKDGFAMQAFAITMCLAFLYSTN
jgi:hypothetical protein